MSAVTDVGRMRDPECPNRIEHGFASRLRQVVQTCRAWGLARGGGGTGWPALLALAAGGVLVGATALLVAWSAVLAQGLFREAMAVLPMAALVVTPAGFVLVAWLTRRLAPGAGGSGIPQVVVAMAARDDRFRASLVSLRIGIVKVVLLPLGLAIGASIGREGPTVQIGASIMYAVSRLAPRWTQGLIAAGAAAGVAAAFNTPFAGIVFAIEELTHALEARLTAMIVGTVAAAGLASLLLMGDYAYFGIIPGGATRLDEWLAVPLVGVAGGLAGGCFCRALAGALAGLPGRFGGWLARHHLLVVSVCGGVVALCGLASGGATYGTGYDPAYAMLHGTAPADWTFAPLKYLATLASAISGIPGGIFAPSLSIGTGLGLDLAPLVPAAAASTLGLMGMVAFLTGVVQAPITATVFVLEMSGNHALTVPLLLVALAATGTARLISPKGFYHLQADTILKRHRLAAGA